MSSYSSEFAYLYDLFYCDKPYATECDFISQCLTRFCGKDKVDILDLACGTGGHSLPLAKRGHRLVALDCSQSMLKKAASKATADSVNIDFHLSNMRRFSLPDRSFDAILCLFDSIGYLQSDQAIADMLQRVYQHLRVGGVFILEFWHAGAMLNHFEPCRVLTRKTKDVELIRVSNTELDRAQDLAKVNYKIYKLNLDFSYSCFEEQHVNRFFTVEKMSSFLQSARLKPIQWSGGYAAECGINDRTWHVVSISQK